MVTASRLEAVSLVFLVLFASRLEAAMLVHLGMIAARPVAVIPMLLVTIASRLEAAMALVLFLTRDGLACYRPDFEMLMWASIFYPAAVVAGHQKC